MKWRKSSYSEGGVDVHCVETAPVPAGVAVRDSKHPEGGFLGVSWSVFGVLLADVKRGRYDR